MSRILLCRPHHLSDMTPGQAAVWNELIARSGAASFVYEGSTFRPCQNCGISIAVGPRQQDAIALWEEHDLEYQAFCFFCGIAQAQEDANTGPGFTLTGHLGNTGP